MHPHRAPSAPERAEPVAGSPHVPGPRERSIARLLDLDELPADRSRLGELIEQHGERLGAALAAEAARSDDVFDARSAALYLDLRLRFLEGVIPEAALPGVRRAFERLTVDW